MSRSKFIKMVAIVLVMISSFGFVAACEAAQSIPIFIDGIELNIPPGFGQAIAINDRTMVPLRVISEALGVKVDWDDINKRVLITTNDASTAINREIGSSTVDSSTTIPIYVNGKQLEITPEDGLPIVINNRTLVPLRVISEALGVKVDWDSSNNRVLITTDLLDPEEPEPEPSAPVNTATSIFGEPVASSAQLKALLKANNPDAPDLVDLYLTIGREYGIRGDIAFCQAAKETGWWRFTGLVKPEQNNYCGLWATGSPATGEENLNGADPNRVWFVKDSHGAYFDTPATGVEAQIQHLWAYACTKPLPAGKTLLDPRFVLVQRGSAPNWEDLGGKWARPGFDRNKYASFEEAYANGETYGQSIISNYYLQAFK
ncbi:MAG: stalk domain-containing protein [Syntrophomonadaceae bacterium]